MSRNASFLASTVLLAVAAGGSTERAWCDDWTLTNQRQHYIALGYTADSDALHGFEIGYGIRDPTEDFGVERVFWASRLSDGDQQVTSAGCDLLAPLFPVIKWGALSPLLSLGLDHRSQPPDQGMGGFMGLGGTIIWWTPRHWQFNLSVERAFGISSQTRNEAKLAVAYAWP